MEFAKIGVRFFLNGTVFPYTITDVTEELIVFGREGVASRAVTHELFAEDVRIGLIRIID